MCAPTWAHCLCGDEAGLLGGGRWVTKQMGVGVGSQVLPESVRVLVLTARGLGAVNCLCCSGQAGAGLQPGQGPPARQTSARGAWEQWGPFPRHEDSGVQGKGALQVRTLCPQRGGRSDGEGKSEALARSPAWRWAGVRRVCTGLSPGTAQRPAFCSLEAPRPGLSKGPCPVGALQPGRVTCALWFAHEGPKGNPCFCRPGCGEGPARCCWPPNQGPPWTLVSPAWSTADGRPHCCWLGLLQAAPPPRGPLSGGQGCAGRACGPDGEAELRGYRVL